MDNESKQNCRQNGYNGCTSMPLLETQVENDANQRMPEKDKTDSNVHCNGHGLPVSLSKENEVILLPQAVDENKSDRNYPACNGVNVLKTVAAYTAFFGAGMGNAIIGATILQLQEQTESTKNQMASIFTWRALGSMLGNILIAVMFDRIPPEVILCIGSFVLCMSNLVLPFCPTYLLLVIGIVINGFSHGTLGGGCNSYVVKTWRLKAPPFVQALQFITSFGSSIMPIIVEVFVAESYDAQHHHGHNENQQNLSGTAVQTLSEQILTRLRNISMDSSLLDSSEGIAHNVSESVTNETIQHQQVSSQGTGLNEIFYPFLIIAVILFVASVTFLCALSIDILQFRKTSISKTDSFIKQQREPKEPVKHKPALAAMFVFCIIYGGMECTYGAWILVFAIKYLDTSFRTAALISTAYWGALAGGRALSIILTKVFNPAVFNCLCLISATGSIMLLTFTCHLHIAINWACSIIIGLSFAPVFGNCISFGQRELNLSGRVTPLLVVCLYIGFMGLPALVGYLFVNYTPMFFLYILCGGAMCITTLFFGIVNYIRCFVKKPDNNKLVVTMQVT